MRVFDSGSRIGDSASVQAATRVNADEEADRPLTATAFQGRQHRRDAGRHGLAGAQRARFSRRHGREDAWRDPRLREAQERATALSRRSGRGETLQGLIAGITLNPEGLEIGIRTAYLDHLLRRGEEIGANETIALPDQPVLVLTIAAQLKRTGIEKKLLIGGMNKRSQTMADAGLLKLIARAHELQEIFTRGGRPISEMAEAVGVSSSYFTRMLRLSFLAPDITQAILHGRQPADLNAHKLMADTRAPIDWHEQRAGLGFI